jgi:hypothetical protein
MSEKAGNLSFEQELLKELSADRMGKEQIEELVALAAQIHRGGLRKVRSFPKGTPFPDGVRLSGIIEQADLGKFFGETLSKLPYLGRVSVFPFGIPWPEIFKVDIDLGRLPEMGGGPGF